MLDSEEEREKYSLTFRSLSPEEFAKEFGNTNYFYQKRCFEKLVEEYVNQSNSGKKQNRPELSSSLENASTALYLVVKSLGKVCDACRSYIKNHFKNMN